MTSVTKYIWKTKGFSLTLYPITQTDLQVRKVYYNHPTWWLYLDEVLAVL